MGLFQSVSSKPMECVKVGDVISISRWWGLKCEKREVVNIDERRHYAIAGNQQNDALYIVTISRECHADVVAYALPARCSYSAYMAATPSNRHFMAWGF